LRLFKRLGANWAVRVHPRRSGQHDGAIRDPDAARRADRAGQQLAARDAGAPPHAQKARPPHGAAAQAMRRTAQRESQLGRTGQRGRSPG